MQGVLDIPFVFLYYMALSLKVDVHAVMFVEIYEAHDFVSILQVTQTSEDVAKHKGMSSKPFYSILVMQYQHKFRIATIYSD